MKRLSLIGCITGMLALPLAAQQPRRPDRPPAQRPIPQDIIAHLDIEYARVGEKSLQLDLYLPREAKAPLPLVVWIHGGAWLGGNRRNPPALSFVSSGYAIASISYRLSHEAIFPAQIHDCKAAIRSLRANANKYGLDPDRIGVWGSSAGGHLVALLGTSGDVRELEGDVGTIGVSSRVQAVCDWFGPTDFLKMGKNAIDHDAPDSPEAKLIGGPIRQNKQKVTAANPISYVTQDDPPFLIMHGDKDDVVPINQSQLLHEALKKAGVPVTCETVEGAGHGFRGQEHIERVRRFFDEHLKK